MKILYLSIIIGLGIVLVIFGGIVLITPSTNKMVILSGDKAWQVCAALKVPCSMNPTFNATQIGYDTYVVVFKINDQPYKVTISGATSSVVPVIIYPKIVSAP